MRTFSILLALVIAFMLAPLVGTAQETLNVGYNDLSVRPIHASDIMYKKRVWRTINLKEKQNASFFAQNREITRLLIDATKQGIITPYESDTLGTPMAMEKFLQNITDPTLATMDEEESSDGAGGGDDWGSGGGDDWGSDWGGGGDDGFGGAEEETSGDTGGDAQESTGPSEDQYYLPRQLYVIELKEDVIFDKVRSRMYYDILTVKVVIDGNERPDGVNFDVAVFSYKELVDKLFKGNTEALWYNPENSAAHLNLENAFDLRLFNSRIIKVGNTEDSYIADVYGDPEKTLYGSEWWEMKLMQYEHELWSY